MLIYLDLCCLKRPFDDQSQPRIRLESEAVLGLLGIDAENIRFVHSPALILENSCNSVKERAARVNAWLVAKDLWTPNAGLLEKRTAELMRIGFKNFDALHLASAEQSGAEVLASCDDRLLSNAKRNKAKLKVRVLNIVDLAKEILK